MSLFARTLLHTPKVVDYIEPFITPIRPVWNTWSLRARVNTVRNESHNTFTLVLKPARRALGLRLAFNFSAGQHIGVWMKRDGRYLCRYFSISSSPAHFEQTGFIELTIQVQAQGHMTPWMRTTLSRGAWVGLTEPQGDFLLPTLPTPLLLLAAGSGITPFRSFLQQLAHEQYTQPITLMYSHRERRPVFQNELVALMEALPMLTVRYIHTPTDGRLKKKILRQALKLSSNKQAQVYVCGPRGFIATCQQKLMDVGCGRQRIHIEHFGAPSPSDLPEHYGTVTFKKQQKTIVTRAKQTILDAGEAQGMPLASGCRMGICKQCQCKKTHGIVYNTTDKIYSDSGEERIRLCVSVPVGDIELEA